MPKVHSDSRREDSDFKDSVGVSSSSNRPLGSRGRVARAGPEVSRDLPREASVHLGRVAKEVGVVARHRSLAVSREATSQVSHLPEVLGLQVVHRLILQAHGAPDTEL